jgi:hypothetical protein
MTPIAWRGMVCLWLQSLLLAHRRTFRVVSPLFVGAAGGLHNLQIRVGDTLPTSGLSGDSLISANAVCGAFVGPSQTQPNNEFTVTCSAPLKGRYISL